jgi:hypothetical protein
MRLKAIQRTETTRRARRTRLPRARATEPERPQRVWSLLLSPRDFRERR